MKIINNADNNQDACAENEEEILKDILKNKIFYDAKVISEALPFINKFAGKIFVIKIGGSAMGNKEILHNFAKDVVLLRKVGIKTVVVHGGGPQIGQILKKFNISSEFIDGIRVTSKEAIKIVEMVLSGRINRDIVQEMHQVGGVSIGLSGKDANLIQAKKIYKVKKDPESNIDKIMDLGYVGEPCAINTEIINDIIEANIIPVIAPIGVGKQGETYNINADVVAGKLATALNATKLVVLSDVDGVLDKEQKLITEIDYQNCRDKIKSGVIKGGMIPKVEKCIEAVENGVETAHIINGKKLHILLIEILTEKGYGTMITNKNISF